MRKKVFGAGLVTLSVGLLFTAGQFGSVTYADSDPEAKYGPGLREILTEDLSSQAGEPGVKDADTLSVIIRAGSDISDELTALGVTVRTVIGDGEIITADVPMAALEEVAKLGTLASIDAPTQAIATNDLARETMQVDAVWNKTVNATNARGQGVLVGIVDSGIDFTHPDFQRADGSSRIIAIWDQTTEGTPPTGYTYGNLCTTMTETACSQRDTAGHGTSVAGTAAGNGLSGTYQELAGMAPEADIIVAKTPLMSDRIIDSWNWMVQQAADRNQPLVINSSLGSHMGPHDGRSDMDVALDSLAGPGKIFVGGAGNDGDKAIHAQATLAGSQSATFAWSYGSGSPQTISYLRVWTGPDNLVAYTLHPPAGLALVNDAGGACPTSLQPGLTEPVTCSGGGYKLTIQNLTDPSTEQNLFSLLIELTQGGVISGDWSVQANGVEIAGNGVLDAYLPIGGNAGGSEVFANPTFAGTVLEPGTAQKAIAVGALVTRSCWEALDKSSPTFCYIPAPTVGDRASFSSLGPTRDGRTKPDVLAPGQGNFSTMSSSIQPSPPELFVHPGGRHSLQQGTSVASPAAAGVIALLLQAKPDLTPDAIKSALSTTSTDGKLNALALYDKIFSSTPAPKPTSVLVDPQTGGKLTNNTGTITVEVPPGAVDEPVTLTYEPKPDFTPPSGGIALGGFSLTATTGDGKQVTKFGAPLTITVRYDPAQLGGVSPEAIQIYFQNAQGEWVALPMTVDTANHITTAQVDHLTVFGAFAMPGDMKRAYIPVVVRGSAGAGW